MLTNRSKQVAKLKILKKSENRVAIPQEFNRQEGIFGVLFAQEGIFAAILTPPLNNHFKGKMFSKITIST